jgi:predicted O-methyltransferase YrrM
MLFKRGRQRIVPIRGDSHSEETLRRVLDILSGNKLDLLFIDGDHSYEGVKKDYETYSTLVRKGGVIAFHDIVPGPQHLVGGVPRFWSKLKNSLPDSNSLEIVAEWNQGGYGIGVVTQ